MEDIILHTLEDTKVRFDLAALIRIGIVLALVIAFSVALSILRRRLNAKPETAGDLRRRHIYRISFRLIRLLIYVAGAIAILRIIGINFTGLTVIFALVVLLFALAVKDALQDIFAGVVIVTDKYFSVGDAVEYEGKDGIVISFTARTTKIQFLDDRSVLSVANRNISQIRKLTHLVDVDLPLPYEITGQEARRVLSGIVEEIDALEGVESCTLKGTQDFGPNAILYKIRFFCEPKNKPDIRREALRVIQEGLEKADIRIPYQQIDIHQR